MLAKNWISSSHVPFQVGFEAISIDIFRNILTRALIERNIEPKDR